MTTTTDLKVDVVAAGMWCDAVWSDIEGWASLEAGIGGRRGATGSYEFETFAPKWFRWPLQRNALLARAEELAHADLYVCPMLRTSAHRRKGNGIGGAYLWADIDDWNDAKAAMWAQLATEWSFVIASGSDTSRHLYLYVGEWLEAAHLEQMNRRLANHLGADHKWAENSLLRLPGSYNHKGRADGGTSSPVRWVL